MVLTPTRCVEGGLPKQFSEQIPQILDCRVAFIFSAGKQDFYLSWG